MPNKPGKYLFILILGLFLAATLSVVAIEETLAESAQRIKGKKVALVIAYRDFQDTEFNVPRNMFQKEGALLTIVSSKKGKAIGSEGMNVETDMLIDDVDVTNFDAVVFIGGKGVQEEYWDNPKAHAVAQEAVKQGKVLAAICWGPVILANAGVLDGKKGTVADYGDAVWILKKKGCKYNVWNSVVVDGKIITANGRHAAKSFAKAIIKSLE